MGRFISNFETTAAFEAAQANLEKPHVSLTQDDMAVHFIPYDPYNGHDYVEISGLKWATMNIGAATVTDYGLYFQWGDTQGYTASQVGTGEGQKYFREDYKYGDGNDTAAANMTKYNAADGKTVLEDSDDAVKVAWGGEWRMPTISEWQTLSTEATSAWTADYEGSGVAGFVLTDKTDSSKKLFLPAAGAAIWGDVDRVDEDCYYWSNSLFSQNPGSAYGIDLSNSGVNWQGYHPRTNGRSIRAVTGTYISQSSNTDDGRQGDFVIKG